MERLFESVLTASFHGSIVIAAVLILRLVLKRAPKKYICMLWLLAGLRLLMPFEIQSGLSLQPHPQRLEQRTQAMWQAEPYSGQTTPASEGQSPAPAEPTSSAESGSPASPLSDSVVSHGSPAPESSVSAFAVAAHVWLAVMGGFLIYSLAACLRLRRRVRDAVKIPGAWESEHIETAFILGLVRPRIYIPMGISPRNRRYILAHERAHLDRGDHWSKFLGYAALAIHWFNPLVWAAFTLFSKDMEMACDEKVVRDMDLEERKAYSSALLRCSARKIHLAAMPVAFGEVSVKERIRSVLNYRKPGFWISLAAVIAVCFVAVCLVTTPDDSEGEPQAAQTTAGTGSGFLADKSQEEIPQLCLDALEELRGRDSYAVRVQSSGESTNPSYSADLYIIQTEGFVNTAPAAAAGAEQAAQRAMAECTLPAAAGLDLGFNKTTVYYDSEAGMWKVEFTASWDDEIYQAVYMDNQGLTRMTVTRK